jgi:hypothetical protein
VFDASSLSLAKTEKEKTIRRRPSTFLDFRFDSTLSSIDSPYRRERNAQIFDPLPTSCSYAFVEFRSGRDAEDAYYEMYVSIPTKH